jgi:Uncharacterised nucleotidyltransferase
MNFFTDDLVRGVEYANAYRLMLAAASADISAGENAVNLDLLRLNPELLKIAKRNRIAPLVAHRLADVCGNDFPGAVRWREVHEQSKRRMADLLDLTDDVAERLDREDIRLVGLKNAGLARNTNGCPACSPAGDLDLLVEPDRFLDAARLIRESGFRYDSRYFDETDLRKSKAVGMIEFFTEVDGERIWLELQHRPVGGRWIRTDQEPTGKEIVERSLPIKKTALRRPEPTDNLLLVCLNAAKHSYVRAPGVKLHTYADRLVAYQPPDWELLIERAKTLQVRHAVYFALALANGLFGTAVPELVFKALEPPHWKILLVRQWLKKAGLFEPDEKKFSRPGMLAFGALLYDDAAGLGASLLGEPGRDLQKKSVRQKLALAGRRLYDLSTRYEKGN